MSHFIQICLYSRFCRLFYIGGLMVLLSGCSLGPLGISNERPPTSGLYRSQDNGVTWSYLSAEFPLLTTLSTTALVSDPNVSSTLYYAPSLFGLYRSWDNGKHWESINSGMPVQNAATITDIIFHPTNSNLLFLVGQFDNIGRVVTGDNGGENWQYLYTDLPASTEVSSLVVDPAKTDRLYAVGTSKPFLASDDLGRTWKALHWFENLPTQVAVQPDAPENIYVITERNILERSRDGGNTWTVVGPSEEVADPRRVYGIKFNPLRPKAIYLATDAGLLYSENLGNSWKSLTLRLPAFEAAIVAMDFHPTAVDTLYLTAGNNIYITYNHGESWEVHKLPVSNRITHILVDRADPQTIYVGTLAI